MLFHSLPTVLLSTFLLFSLFLFSPALSTHADGRPDPSSIDFNTLVGTPDWWSACLRDSSDAIIRFRDIKDPARLQSSRHTPIPRTLDTVPTPPLPPYYRPRPIRASPPIYANDTQQPRFHLKEGKDTSCLAWGYVADKIEETGWSYFVVESNSDYSDSLQATAAGYIEGALMQERIFQNNVNLYNEMFNDTGPADITANFISDQFDWNQQMIHTYAEVDPFWNQIALIYDQLNGMYQGYSDKCNSVEEELAWWDLLYMNLAGDMGDIQMTVNSTLRIDFTNATLPAVLSAIAKNEHCSALIKVTDGNTNLLVGHTTWDDYSSMLRTFKLYTLHFSNAYGTTIHFSSYPAFLDSNDDFYTIHETKLTVLETTNDIVNATLYNYVTPNTVATWMRVIVANRLSRSGDEWATYFEHFNSGTYDNQWMVVDHKRFIPGQAIQPNTLWIASTMPGAVFTADVSDTLRTQSYWASYNRPYFRQIYNAMGYNLLAARYGNYLFGYDNYFRALMFHREQANVQT